MIALKTAKYINLETKNALNLIALGNTSSVRDIKVGGEWKYKKVGEEWKYKFPPQVSLTDQTLIKIRNSGLEKALEFVTSHDVVDMNVFKEADGGMTIKFIYRKSK